MWAGPSSIRQLLDSNDRTISGEHSFRERRQIPRHRIVHLSDQIIGKFVDVLIDACTMRPAINITSLLGLKEHRPNLYSRAGFPSNPFTFQGKKEVKQVDVLKNVPAGKVSEKSLFESFLSHLDLAAAAFSHLEYSIAQTHLNDASATQIKLTKLVESMIQMRTGSYTCKDMRKETRLQSLGQDASPGGDEHVKGHFEIKHHESRGWTWFFGIIGSILIGCLVGYDVSTSKAKRGME